MISLIRSEHFPPNTPVRALNTVLAETNTNTSWLLMPAPEGNDFATGNSGGPGAPPGNQRAVGNSGGGPPSLNGNALTHGAYASPETVWENIGDEHKAWIATLLRDYLEIAPFGREDPRAERLATVCIFIWIEWCVHAEILEDDMSEDRPIEDSDGNVIGIVEDEHHLCREAGRLNDRIRRTLRELNLIGAGSDVKRCSTDNGEGESLAQWLSSAVADTDDGGEASDN